MYSDTEKIRFIQSIFGVGKLSSNGRNLDVRCPFCDPRDKSKKKLSIRLEDDANHCWTCDWKARSLVPLIRKTDFSSLHEYVTKYFIGHKSNVSLDGVEAAEKKVTLPDDFQLLTLAESTPNVLAIKNYVKSRNLTERDLWYFKIGVSNDFRWKRRVIVPSFDLNGKLNYYVARAIDNLQRPKYDNPDQDKLGVIFNEINLSWKDRLVLCEGVFDMFKCGENAVPLLGSTLNEQSLLFNKIIANSTPVAIALDSDMFETKAIKITKKLYEYDIDVVVVDIRPNTDPGSMTKKQFYDCLNNAKPLSWQDTFTTKLNSVTRTGLSL